MRAGFLVWSRLPWWKSNGSNGCATMNNIMMLFPAPTRYADGTNNNRLESYSGQKARPIMPFKPTQRMFHPSLIVTSLEFRRT